MIVKNLLCCLRSASLPSTACVLWRPHLRSPCRIWLRSFKMSSFSTPQSTDATTPPTPCYGDIQNIPVLFVPLAVYLKRLLSRKSSWCRADICHEKLFPPGLLLSPDNILRYRGGRRFDRVLLHFQFGWYSRGSDFTEQPQWWMCLKLAIKPGSSLRGSESTKRINVRTIFQWNGLNETVVIRGVIDKFMAKGRRRWVIRLSLNARAVQLFERLCGKFELNTFWGISFFRLIENCKSALYEKMDIVSPCAVIRYLDLKVLSPRLTALWQSGPLGSDEAESVWEMTSPPSPGPGRPVTFWGANTPRSKKRKGSVCSTTAGLNV